MARVNYGVCEKCRSRVPSTHVLREGKVYISKECPDCGMTEALVSSDAAAWRRKRDIWKYDEESPLVCTLQCAKCKKEHHPKMVFLDVTNRCNMNCPICIANIPGMGFEFHPPFSYIDRVLQGLAKFDPPPTVNLFGGEPTVRDDLCDVIRLGQSYGLRIRVVTNGLRLADEAYCKRLCETGAPVLIAFDGRDPEIYERLRKDPGAYEKKMTALENLRKYSKRKNTIMCCVARKINDKHMRDLIDFCHDNRDHITALHLIPLAETWEEGEFETDITTTIEDVEQIIDEAFPGEKVEFLPAGIGTYLTEAMSFFGSPRLTFGGVHPNCESMTLLVSDGQRYHPLSHYLKLTLDEIGEEAVKIGQMLDGKLQDLLSDKWSQRWRARLIVILGLRKLVMRSINFKTLLRGNRVLRTLRIIGGLLIGKRLKDQLRRHTNTVTALRMLVLPFEEYHSVEGARLENCAAGFAYEDPDTGEIETIPACAWPFYRNQIQRKIAEKYARPSEANPV